MPKYILRVDYHYSTQVEAANDLEAMRMLENYTDEQIKENWDCDSGIDVEEVK